VTALDASVVVPALFSRHEAHDVAWADSYRPAKLNIRDARAARTYAQLGISHRLVGG
jgi:hypothetical protein